ncbi:cellulose synthase-like protein G3 [Musa acuminata AAA Group]|uniref:cellulose synthase-like protein G3 n=1 Tax=Musa acuminata AAA Group TaxID=214697 RepID=UPI0031E3F250
MNGFGRALARNSSPHGLLVVMYESMKAMVERATERGYVANDVVFGAEEREHFEKRKGFTRHDHHPSAIQVLLQSSKDSDIMGNALPNLIYLSREKYARVERHEQRPSDPDCDMYCNNPLAPLHTLCYFLDPAVSADLAFVQFPQCFHGINENDIYASELSVCSGLIPGEWMDSGDPNTPAPVASSRDALCMAPARRLTVARRLRSPHCRKPWKWLPAPSNSIGFRYGSLVEDFHTGYRLYYKGWMSVEDIPIIVYDLLPPLALMYQTPLFPKVSDPWFFVYAYLFIAVYGQQLIQALWHYRGTVSKIVSGGGIASLGSGIAQIQSPRLSGIGNTSLGGGTTQT